MKKLTIVLAIIITVLAINKDSEVIIPKDSIRFRVIANSDSESDQLLKKKVVSNLNPNIINLLSSSSSLTDSRNNIENNLTLFDNIVKNTLKENNSTETYTINYGMNYFPEKEYKGTVYKEGEYESLVVTLGEGKGKNFWCVLFPPLCLLEAEDSTKTTDVEYKSFIKEIIDKYF